MAKNLNTATCPPTAAKASGAKPSRPGSSAATIKARLPRTGRKIYDSTLSGRHLTDRELREMVAAGRGKCSSRDG